MSRLSIILLFALLTVVLATPFTIRNEALESPEPSAEESLEPSISPEAEEDDAVCVDESYLLERHSRHELVHTTPILAATLCPDGGLPCGTANHMVRIDGNAMSYRQLCDLRECSKKNILVNSVLSHVWKEVDHDGVTLTMFDNRHPELVQKAFHWSVAQKRRVFG